MPIVAIGGGEMRRGETRPIDGFIVELTGKRSPNALFVPTASGDAEGYADSFTQAYGNELGCEVDVLNLLSEHEPERISAAVTAADIVYVGGGNTKLLMDTWSRTRLPELLKAASESGTVLCGISAGGMCWFQRGFSDYESFSNESGSWSYSPIDCLGFVKGMFCPHLDSEHRLLPLVRNMTESDDIAYAATDGAALVIDGGKITAIRTGETSSAYAIRSDSGAVELRELPTTTLPTERRKNHNDAVDV